MMSDTSNDNLSTEDGGAIGKPAFMRRLFLLRPVDGNDKAWDPWYDKVFGFVVRADNEKQARALANAQGGDECGPVRQSVYRMGGDPWLDPDQSTCEELTAHGEAGVILRDFAAA